MSEQKQVDSFLAGKFERSDEDSSIVSSTTTFRLPPKTKRWSPDRDFHPDLKQVGFPLLVVWEARAREGIAVAVASSLKWGRCGNGKLYGTEVILGAGGNTETTLRHKKIQSPTVPGRVCTERAWTSYWMCLPNAHSVWVGVGSTPGEQCIAMVDSPNNPSSNTTKDAPAEDTAKDSGDGALEATANDAADIDSANQPSKPQEKNSTRYIGFRNAAVWDRQAPTELLLRNIKLSRLTVSLEGVKPEPLIIVGEEEVSNLSPIEQETIRIFQKHREECIKSQTRAEKFGVEYIPPQLKDSLAYSELRRIRANPSGSVLSGMDLKSAEEQEKLEKRKNRFGSSSSENVVTPSLKATEESTIVIPSDQAWDKMDLIGEQRVDPPSELWLEPQPQTMEEADEFQVKVDPATVLPEKIHIFSIDWAAFKQIRTRDVEDFFGGYGSTYTEWLGDLSCNIHFADKFAAARALDELSQKLPRGKIPDLAVMGWRLAKSMVRKVANDRHGRKGTCARLLMRLANSQDILVQRPSSWKDPPGDFSTSKVLGPQSDFPEQRKNEGTKKIKKRKQKRGSSSRTTEDILQGGLSAGRAGFSMEDLEAERAAKRTKKG